MLKATGSSESEINDFAERVCVDWNARPKGSGLKVWEAVAVGEGVDVAEGETVNDTEAEAVPDAGNTSVIFLMQWFELSAISPKVPAPSTATPAGRFTIALLPTPSLWVATDRVPANVVTNPVEISMRLIKLLYVLGLFGTLGFICAICDNECVYSQR